MAPRKSAAERAAEAAAADAEPTPDETATEADDAEQTAVTADSTEETPDDIEPLPDPEPPVDNPETETETGDADALRYQGADRLGAPEPYVHKKWPHAARGDLASQLLAAATVLGYPLDVVRSTSDGFRYPEGIDRYLFPSEYDE